MVIYPLINLELFFKYPFKLDLCLKLLKKTYKLINLFFKCGFFHNNNRFKAYKEKTLRFIYTMGQRKYITFHYKNLLVSKYKTKNSDEIMKLGNDLILNGLRNNKPLQLQKIVMKNYMNLFHHRRLNKLKVSSQDHIHFVACFLGLMKLKELEEDDSTGYIITKF